MIFELSNIPTNKYSKNYYTESGASKFIDPKDLKAEAIKWVKSMRAEALVAGMPCKELGDRDAVIKFMEFFNLTEEDLK